MNPDPSTFWQVYRDNLEKAIHENPERYGHLRLGMTPAQYADHCAEKWSKARDLNQVSIAKSKAFHRTARHFGVKCTYKELCPIADTAPIFQPQSKPKEGTV